MLFGVFDGGDFVSEAVQFRDTCTMYAYDGRSTFKSESSTGQRFLVEVFQPAGTQHWSADYKQYLTALGFRLSLDLPGSASAAVDQSACSEDAKSIGDTGGASAAGKPTTASDECCYSAFVSLPTDRILVEGCCENGSLLQRRTKFSRGCKVVPITKDDDFASSSGMRKCIENIKGPADTLWFSAPCTGGSTWQFINLRRGPETVAKIKLHWKLFKRLWAAFEVVAEHALGVGARVFVEWPRRCVYWKNDRVAKFLSRHGFVSSDFDGCMYGLVASCGPMTGMPIQKPWRVACSPGSSLPTLLNKRCDGSHDHTPCAGQNTLLTQGYTPEIAKLVHQSIVRDIAVINESRASVTKENTTADATGGASAAEAKVEYSGRSILSVGIDEMDEHVAMLALRA